MDRLYVPDHNHIFRKLSHRSSGDFPRFPGLKYNDIIMKNTPKSDRKNQTNLNRSGPIPSYAVFREDFDWRDDISISLIPDGFMAEILFVKKNLKM